MATIEGAQAVGLGDEVGSLEAGKQADLTLVDMTALNLSPVRVPVSGPAQPGLSGSGHEVKTVMVAGKALVRNADGVRAEVLVTDETAVRAEAQVQAAEVARRVAADPVHQEMALLEAMEAGRL